MGDSGKQEKQPLTEEQKNRDFIQLYRCHLDDVTRLAGENYTAFKLFQLLCKHMDGTNALCVSRTALAELMDCTEKTISRAVKYLKDNGWICVLKTGTSNVYIVNPKVAWTSYDNQKQYCKFQTTVLLSSSENNEYLKNRDASSHFKTIDTDFVKKIAEQNKEFHQEAEQYQQEQEQEIS